MQPTFHDRLPKFSPDEYRILATVGCAFLYFGFTKPEVFGLIAAGVAAILGLFQLWKAFPILGKPKFFYVASIVLTVLFVVHGNLPAHAILDAVEQELLTLLAGTDVDPAAIMNFFTLLDILIILVLVGAVAFAIYQGSQSNDVRPILFAIAFIVGGIMVLEIGSSLILGV